MDYEGLTVVTVDDREWEWIGHELVENKEGEAIRVEQLQRRCHHCHQFFTVVQKLPGYVAKRWETRNPPHQRQRYVVPVKVKLQSRYGNLQLRTCPAHRWLPPVPFDKMLEELV
jgi:hypothetical protein